MKMKTEQTDTPAPPTGASHAATGPEGAKPDSGTSPEAAPEPRLDAAGLQALKAEAAKAREHWEALLRTTADFDNFRKRTARERQDALKYANESLLQKLIPVMDNFDMAIAAAGEAKDSAATSMRTGINMILSQLKNALIEAGLEEIDATGKAFDPNLHEAVSHQETTAAPEGRILQQLRKGYKLRDRLIRPATVVVAKKPGA